MAMHSLTQDTVMFNARGQAARDCMGSPAESCRISSARACDQLLQHSGSLQSFAILCMGLAAGEKDQVSGRAFRVCKVVNK